MPKYEFNNSGGSTYFTYEAPRNADGVFDSTSLKSSAGVITNLVNISKGSIVRSDYQISVVVPPGNSSFEIDNNLDRVIRPTGIDNPSFTFNITGETGGYGILVYGEDTYGG
mgnify:FL=1|tara:strand:- start:761 stop:1096 length:336 start_codon:yes stop_codon:yes gene_type:complete